MREPAIEGYLGAVPGTETYRAHNPAEAGIVAIALVAGERRADAQGFISPFVGYNFGGDSGCPQITNCEDKHVNWGVAVGALGSIAGFGAGLVAFAASLALSLTIIALAWFSYRPLLSVGLIASGIALLFLVKMRKRPAPLN